MEYLAVFVGIPALILFGLVGLPAVLEGAFMRWA